MKFSFKALIGSAALALATATTAVADPINGVIAFSGFSTLNNTHTGVAAFSGVIVGYSAGDFSSAAVGTSVTMGASSLSNASDDWIFNSPSGYTGIFWKVGDFRFILTSSTGGVSGSFVNASGLGYAYNVWDPLGTMATGTWGFSTQYPQIGKNSFFFSSTTSVPDGGVTALLLGAALLGLGLAARRKR
jgi:hypothetical protein